MTDQNKALVKAVDAVLARLPPDDRQALAVWANEVNSIRLDKGISAQDKLLRLQALKSGAAVTPVFRAIGEEAKSSFWDNQGLATRLGAVGALVGLGLGGVKIAAIGSAIGVPAFVLTGAGGVFLGLILEKLNAK